MTVLNRIYCNIILNIFNQPTLYVVKSSFRSSPVELKAGDGLKVGEEVGGRGVEAKGLLVELRGGSAALPEEKWNHFMIYGDL